MTASSGGPFTGEIRRARADEISSLFSIWMASVRATHDFLSEADRAAYAQIMLVDYLPHAQVWAACVDDAPVGFMGMSGAKIDSLFVRPDWMRRGVGRALIAQAVALVGAPRVDVNEQNPGGRAFYARLGFREEGRSARDGTGRPYPLLHLVYAPRSA